MTIVEILISKNSGGEDYELTDETFKRVCKKFPNGLYQDIETYDVYGSSVIKELKVIKK